MWKKDFMAVLVLAALGAFCATPVRAQQDAARGDSAQSAEHHNASHESHHNRAFLGVGVEDVTPALASHLAIQEGEGLVVEHLVPDSPAAKAGIERHDVLLRLDDQRLLSGDQLVKLIHEKKPGETASLELMRQGKKQNVQVTLGEMPANMMAERPQTQAMRAHHDGRGMASARRAPRGSEWERFDSLSLQKTGKNEFKATIAYLDDQGKVERHEFQGTPEQIHKALAGEKDVPHSEREHLYRALNMSESGSIPGVRFIPGEGLMIDFGSLVPDQSNQHQPVGQEF
jgi:hypothetical protein